MFVLPTDPDKQKKRVIQCKRKGKRTCRLVKEGGTEPDSKREGGKERERERHREGGGKRERGR